MRHYILPLFLLLFVFTSCSTEQEPLTEPNQARFTKTALSTGQFYEPIDMTILPNMDVLIAQRRGALHLYHSDTGELTVAAEFDVYSATDVPGVNAEEGLVGIKADPDFANNSYVYAYYSPVDTSVNRLSRFVFDGERLDMDSETIILDVWSQRDICCHTGGAMAFDNDGLLYLSTGDNSTPFNQQGSEHTLDGFAPLDARPGFEQYDARRSAGNANDLRGKVLRIRVNEDGSYDIPEGNLYPEGTEGTRPEIYVQGLRNPYMISVDPKTGYLYWGDIGPDSRQDSTGYRGPIGYDEINQAREAGHFGWPYFVGDNYPYTEFDFAEGVSGETFDPENPVNRSPNNTGIENLPPAQPAFIYYPYSVSEQFPEMGTGGRNAMAGPVYYSDLYPEETRLNDYYDSKFLAYDWSRSLLNMVTMDENGDYESMEPFLRHIEFNAPIDIELGPDGHLYVLEYGTGWFTQNDDSGLFRIDFDDSDDFMSDEGMQAGEGDVSEEGHQE